MNVSKSPSYLLVQGTTYFFRMALPVDVRKILKRRELKVSLKTNRLPDARRRAKRLSLVGDELIRKAKTGHFRDMADEHIQALVNKALKKALDDDLKIRIDHGKNYEAEYFDTFLSECERNPGKSKFLQKHHDPGYAQSYFKEILDEHRWLELAEEAKYLLDRIGVPLDENSHDFNAFCYFYAQKAYDYFGVIQGRNDNIRWHQNWYLDELNLDEFEL